MHIFSFKFKDVRKPGWNFSELRLRRTNLLVGESGSGKTRILNALFNIGRFIAINDGVRSGSWRFVLVNGDVRYIWEYETSDAAGAAPFINRERLQRADGLAAEETIVEREGDRLLFRGKALPKIARDVSTLYLFREEDVVRPVFELFTRIMRRSFFSDELERAASFQRVPPELIQRLRQKGDMARLADLDLNVSVRLKALQKVFPGQFEVICQTYKGIFPSIERIEIVDASKFQPGLDLAGDVPMLAIWEKTVNYPVPINQLSSGMQKVLLILTDVILLQAGSVYMIDEYENSLGINAINFLPAYLLEHGGENQFLITTHHPYLINHIPVRDWHVFHRRGMDVRVRSGEEYEEKFGKSKQKAFVQLINDPFFSEGVE